ncbi:MAG TPA: S8 family serine peptidase [Actinomycetota bacterium]|nr:S8 family serine peptidase [Actinomycetota bacterium]
MRLAASAATVMVVAALAAPVAAAPGPREPGSRAHPTGFLADRDGDRVDDGLEAQLAAARPSDRLDVVATFGNPSGARAAGDALPAGALRARFQLIHGFAATVSAAHAEALAHRPGLIRLEPDFRVTASMEAADRDFGTEQARADYGVDGAGSEICVVDTGVDPTHEQLDSKAPIPFHDLVNGHAVAYDDQGHGTHVASIAAGDGTGGSIASLFNGVAPAASLSAVKVLDASGIGQDSDVVLGIEWCAARASVDVINVSVTSELGSDGLDAVSQAANAAVADGIVVVAAAGNTGDIPGSVASPASATGVITVGAVAEWSAPAGQPWRSEGIYLAPFSSRGPTIDGRIKPDVVAPGVSIAAASANSPDSYEVKDGTSMASPFIAGLAALLLDRQPTWTPAQVKSTITTTAKDAGPSGADPDWGAGLVDGLAAVSAAAGGTAQTSFPAHQRFTGSVAAGGSWTKTFSIEEAALGVPIAVTVMLDGSPVCVIPWFDDTCLLWEWNPDIEAQLIGPGGFALDTSTCAAGDECTSGRQETLHVTPTATGTYTIRVHPAAGAPGTSFGVDLFTGPAGSPPPPPPPPPPAPRHHVGDLDGSRVWVTANKWRATATITVHDRDHGPLAGALVKGTWTGGKVLSCTTNANGRCSVSNGYGRAKASARFTVSSVTFAGSTYASGANHDPDSDSLGTFIVINRPA